MKIYLSENSKASGKKVALEDMILTCDMPTTAGSRMLDGYMSLFRATVIDRLEKSGFSVSGKINVGEFASDIAGETSYFGKCTNDDGTLASASALALKDKDLSAVVGIDVTGTMRRAAALGNLVALKPTYGTVSRFGTIPVACSGETVSVLARKTADIREVLDSIAGHDDKDGTSLPEEKCELVRSGKEIRPVKKIALAKGLISSADEDTRKAISSFVEMLNKNNIETVEIDDDILMKAKTAWNILFSAELCNNVSRYDGIKFGYRTENYTNIDELYTNSRTEAFGFLLKSLILFGSESLSTEKYMTFYDKSLRMRRIICEKFADIFTEYDAVLMPACGKTAYTEKDLSDNTYLSLEENLYTAPASITGLPSVVCGGVQLTGKAFSENVLLSIADIYEKEAK